MRAAGGYDTPQGGSLTSTPFFPPEYTQQSPAPSDVEATLGGRGNNSAAKVPRILLMGLRRSGKTSIFKVVFHKMSPHETYFLESTVKTVQYEVDYSSVLHFKVWDLAGATGAEEGLIDDRRAFVGAGAVVFVLDAQDDHVTAVQYLLSTIQRAYALNKRIVFEVFIHKVDGLNEDRKLELQREISHNVTKELSERGLDDANVAFYLSSIYDHSVYENVSKVVQKLVPQLATLENLLDILISNCRMEKAFLFDVLSKVYIATDSQPVDEQWFELSSDMLDVVVDISCIYGQDQQDESVAFDAGSAAIISLNNGMVLYMKEVSKYLALVCLMRSDNLQRQGLIEYNVDILKHSLKDVLTVGTGTPRASMSAPSEGGSMEI